MFSGIIRTTGIVTQISPTQLAVTVQSELRSVKPGGSVAVNGTCLTVRDRNDRELRFDLLPSTRQRTTLGALTIGDVVNLEPSLRLGDTLDGHLVTGHVDTVGHVTKRRDDEAATELEVSFPDQFQRLVAAQGSVALDGTSLTVVAVSGTQLSVSLTPTTQSLTTLGTRVVGDTVNIEFDVLAHYVQSNLRESQGSL